MTTEFDGSNSATLKEEDILAEDILAEDTLKVETPQKPRCTALTTSGERCKRDATNGDLCGLHAAYIRNKTSTEALITVSKKVFSPKATPPEIIPDIPPEVISPKVTLKEDSPKAKIQSATSPWDSTDNPWSIDKMKLKKKHTGFRPKFVSSAKMSTRKHEGWVIAQGKDYGEDKTPVTRGEMILMEIPEGMANLRETHYRKLTKQRSMSAREILLDNKTKEMTQLTEAA